MRWHSLLAVLTLVLGASTTWLAVELYAVRRELAESRASPASSATAHAMTRAAAGMRAAEVPVQAAAITSPPNQPGRPRDERQARADASLRAANLLHTVWVRSWIDDPEKRAKVLADHRNNHEREFPRELLDLNDDDHNQLVATLAASDLRYAEAIYRCNTDPACNLQSTVDSMSMSDAQAEKLADSLGDERRRIVQEWEQRGERISGMANMWGSLNFPDMPDLEQRATEAAEFQRRQRERAAEVLTSAQLEVFSKQQEQMLEIARGSWEVEDQSSKPR
jgi:hypothetical protein